MKLFERTGGHWLFWTGVIYLVIGLADIFLIKVNWSPWLQVGWITVISSPFLFPPLGRWLNLDIEWDRKMFDWFGKKDKTNNVVPFPEPRALPKAEPEPEPEKPAKVFYRLGITDNNRVAFNMGYSEITMNKAGVQQMIDQLEFFKSQLHDETE